MDSQRRFSIVLGVILVLFGVFILAVQFIPALGGWITLTFSWPWIIIGVGLFLFLLALFTGTPGMAVPASIVTGIGGILYWQNAVENFASWSYAWSLIPGFAGIGRIIAGLLGEDRRRSIQEGINMILVSLVLFAIFGSIFGGFQILGQYWPVLLILLGVWFLLQALFRTRKSI